MSILILTGQLFYFFLPAGVANMSPVLFKNYFKFLAIPVDFGRRCGVHTIFGSHKTWRGLIVGTIAGGLFFIFQVQMAKTWPGILHWSAFDITAAPLWFGFIFSAGALAGDLIKSFIKRRVAIAPGKTWFPFDQIDFLVGSTIIITFFFHVTFLMWIIIIAVGIFLHILVNHIGYWIKLKDSPW